MGIVFTDLIGSQCFCHYNDSLLSHGASPVDEYVTRLSRMKCQSGYVQRKKNNGSTYDLTYGSSAFIKCAGKGRKYPVP